MFIGKLDKNTMLQLVIFHVGLLFELALNQQKNYRITDRSLWCRTWMAFFECQIVIEATIQDYCKLHRFVPLRRRHWRA